MMYLKFVYFMLAVVILAFVTLVFISAALSALRSFLRDVIRMYFQSKADYYKQMAQGPMEELLKRDVKSELFN